MVSPRSPRIVFHISEVSDLNHHPPVHTITMTTTMAPPPPKTAADEASSSDSAKPAAMDPPPSRNPNPSEPESYAGPSENRPGESELNPTPSDTTTGKPANISNSSDSSNDGEASGDGKKQDQRNRNAAVPYTIPPWSGPPYRHFFIEILKDGAIVDQHDVIEKGAYMFGRVDLCDFVLEHPTISRFHAVLQFKSNGGAYLYDLGSTHGTSINKNQVKKRVYVDLNVGDVIRFGLSSRLYIFQGPHDLMPPETDLKSLRTAKNRQERHDMEASLLRAKVEASRADGISWGMQEDAVEENEDDVEEITWQTYKGQLTERQEKTREKVIKRLEKIAHMKKEIDAIRAKDIAQGGLTQGQQTQIARNEQRMSQIMEELENLEETLNESIRESLGARGKLSRGKKGAVDNDEEDYLSDDDEFYDRTKKSSKHKPGENQSVETADSLLDKKDALTKQIQDKEKLLLEDGEAAKQNEVAEAGDALDAYMSAVSSELVLDRKEKLQKEMSTLQSELDRILYLLRIADPTGEAAKKRECKVQNPKTIVSKKPSLDTSNRPLPQKNLEIVPSSSKNKQLAPVSSPVKSSQEKTNANSISEPDAKNEDPVSKNEESGTPTVFTVAKPQWLGAVEDRQKQETAREDPVDTQDTADQFVDYKDREKILNKTESLSGDQGIEDAAPGLIIRKRKQVEKSKDSEAKDPEETNNNNGAGFKAEDAVALLLRHSRGYHASEEEDGSISGDVLVEKEGKKEGKKAKRVLGPDKPAFVDEPDYTTWVPPEGQLGDGRTSLNDRFGY